MVTAFGVCIHRVVPDGGQRGKVTDERGNLNGCSFCRMGNKNCGPRVMSACQRTLSLQLIPHLTNT